MHLTSNYSRHLSKRFFLLSLLLLVFMTTFTISAAQGNFADDPNYIVWISKKPKFVWFRVAKVGSTTIKAILGRKNMSIKSENFAFNPKKYEKYFKFAFVRNPWDRVVSCYCQKVENENPLWEHYYGECFGKGFEYFVNFIAEKDLKTADRHIRLQTALVPVNECDFIGRLENFEEDLQYVLGIIGIQKAEIPKKNPSTRLHYSHYYNEKTKEIIAHKYKDDIETFGYQFEVQ